MAISFSCKCPERKKPAAERNWIVIDRNCHYSVFGGGHRQWSERSTVWCLSCGAVGRTKANYVTQLKDQA